MSAGESGGYVEKTGAGAFVTFSVLLHDAVMHITAHRATDTGRNILIVCRNLHQGRKKSAVLSLQSAVNSVNITGEDDHRRVLTVACMRMAAGHREL